MPGDWIKCPRCDLNYMRKGEEYCDVCKAQLKKGPQLVFAIDDEDDSEFDAMELCPICHQNYIKQGESMCKKCAEDLDYKESREDPDDDESWKEYLDQDDEDEQEDSEEMLSLAKLAEEVSNDRGLTTKEMEKNLHAIIKSFSNVPRHVVPKVKVGIVGEIFVKYSGLGNNELEAFLASQDCEVMVPGLMGFMLFKIDNNRVLLNGFIILHLASSLSATF